MAQKRKHDEAPGDASAAPKPFKKHRASKPAQNTQQFKHPKRRNPSHDDDHGRSSNALKSRIRDLKRFLAHMDSVPKHKMSAGARQERERELEACEHELAEKLHASREAEYRKRMIAKYHQVRFFDRKKGTRILKRLTKELSALDDDSERAKLQQQIHNAQVDVNYAIYYPLMKPYSSLYPKSKNKKSSDSEDAGGKASDDAKNHAEMDGPKGDVDMWRTVEQAMEHGTLEKLRYSKDALPAEPPKKSKKPPTNKDGKQDRAEGKKSDHVHAKAGGSKNGVEEEDEESDGGFFE
ncbi:18S rRNA maturation protein [Pleosporales sp. CAS-2024a]